MQKLDLRKDLKHLYAPFLMLDGGFAPGDTPETSETFQQAFGALYGVAFTLKFISKLRKENPIDYSIMALEGLWWVSSGEFDFDNKDNWQWTLMMLQPDHITEAMFRDAADQVGKKRPNPALSKLRLEPFREGLCMQIMHVGPYADEPATIERMHAFARENGYVLRGKHHEIYLGDPRRAKPEKLKTILRQPIEKA
jgi:hypothetical protein